MCASLLVLVIASEGGSSLQDYEQEQEEEEEGHLFSLTLGTQSGYKWGIVEWSGITIHRRSMESLTPTQPFFAGEFRHSIDEKNRLTIPSRWRQSDADEFILLPEAQHQCLLVMSPEAFDRMTGEVETNSGVNARDRRVFLRHLHARAQHGAADKQGRLVLPEEMCRALGLKGEVALVGGRGRFEIWNLQKWKRAHAEDTATYQHVANVIGL